MAARAVLVSLFICLSRAADAQCPNGSPPPCATRRAAPPANVRARHFLLLPFRNVTRKPDQDWLAAGAPLMFAQILGRFRDLEVVPEEGLAAARRKLGIGPDATADAAQLRLLADETGGWTAVTGNVFAAGDRLRITVQAMDVASARVLVRAETEISADADVREAFDRLSIRLLEPAGVPPTAAPLAALTTASVDAFRAYARGMELYPLSRFREAEAEFTRAVTLDSTFAMAWSALSATSISTGGLQVILNPMSIAYRAAERAARLSEKLPPREAQFIRAITGFFHGEIRRSRRQLDSLLAVSPGSLDVAYWIATAQLVAIPVDTSRKPPRLETSPNRAVALANMILDRDPGRRYAFTAPLLLYSLAGGFMWGDMFGQIREFSSFALALMTPPALREVPVVRGDSIEMMPRSAFDSLSVAEQSALRRKAADVAWTWAERWLLAGPEDADAHMWAGRVAELREDYARALAELRAADSIGIQSSLENRPGWHLSLLMLAGRNAEAAAMADSMLVAGTLTNAPFLRIFDRRRSYGAAALLLDKRWDRAAKMAESMRPPAGESAPCASLWFEIVGFDDAVLPERIRRAVMDTVAAHLPEVNANATLAPCTRALSTGLLPP